MLKGEVYKQTVGGWGGPRTREAGFISLPTTWTQIVAGKYKQVSSKARATLSLAIKLALPRLSSEGDSPTPSAQRVQGRSPSRPGLAR